MSCWHGGHRTLDGDGCATRPTSGTTPPFPTSTWWDNQNEVLTLEATRESVEEPVDAYRWIWEHDGLEVPINPTEYYPVAVEGNANLTLAHRVDGRLLLFAPDHAFERVTPFAGSPPCSLLTMDEVPDLATWIEVCAAAWHHP